MRRSRLSAATELANVRAIFVGNEEVAEQAHGDGFRIESFRRERVGGVKGVRVAYETAVPLVFEKPGSDELGRNVGERRLRVDVDMQEVKAIEVWDIGSAVERPAIWNRQKDLVEAGIRNARAQPSEGRLIDADGGVIALADRLACQTRAIQGIARDETNADESHAGVRRRQRHDGRTENQCTPTRQPSRSHVSLHV